VGAQRCKAAYKDTSVSVATKENQNEHLVGPNKEHASYIYIGHTNPRDGSSELSRILYLCISQGSLAPSN
jgi:hypothetical protein